MRANRVLKLAVAYTLAAASSVALAQNAPQTSSTELETVVVTGSYIKGSAEDAALPVAVITAEDLEKRGSPSTLEMIKDLPESAGVLGDTNQFDARGAQGTEGSGSVNLRGLGPSRTLVLLNGRRIVNNPLTGAADTNVLPMYAIGRVEVLKDGAAATYGSDAIAGVVNFITKKTEGFDLAADYTKIQGSDGDYDAGGSFGWKGSAVDFMLSVGYEHRSELQVIDRDWAHKSYFDNPEGGWSGGGNPEAYVLRSAANTTTGTLLDPSCNAIGGVGTLAASGFPLCNWQYTQFDNLVELQNRYQVYGEVNVHFGATVEWHTQAMFARTDVPHYKTSPSYLATQGPTGATLPAGFPAAGLAGNYYVPNSNPGVQAFINAHPTITTQQGTTAASSVLMGGGVLLPSLTFRPFAIGGNPLFGYSSSEAKRVNDFIDFSTGLKGDITDNLSFDVAVTYSSEKITRNARDTMVDRYQLALRGLGGPNCNPVTGVAGDEVNCFYVNPFGNAIPSNAVSGVANPEYNPGTVNGHAVNNNNTALIDWFFPEYNFWTKNSQAVADAVLNGKTGLTLPGGDIGWAFGSQYRKVKYENYIDDISNLDVNPCVDPVGFPGSTCTSASPSYGAGVFMFLGGAHNLDLSQKVYAFFGELSLPIAESFQAQVAARYEKYDQGVGATVNPKLAVRYQVNDVLALRGSIGSTFRGPPVQNLAPGSATSLQNINGTFRPIDTFGNPALQPEKALNYNVGFLIKNEGFSASVDYWNFKFDQPIVIEPLNDMVAKMFAPYTDRLGVAHTDHCGDLGDPLVGRPSYAQLQNRFSMPAGCAIGNIARVHLNWINGSTTRTSGLDFDVKYHWQNVLGGDVTSGVAATYVIKYQQESLNVEGVQVQDDRDAVGFFNVQTTAYPLPKWKGNLYGNYSTGNHNVRLVMNYIDGYDDQRTAPFTQGTYPAIPFALTWGQHIPSLVTFDAHYNLQLASKTTFTFSVENIADRDPPFVRAELNYDSFTANPIGRTFKLTVGQKF